MPFYSSTNAGYRCNCCTRRVLGDISILFPLICCGCSNELDKLGRYSTQSYKVALYIFRLWILALRQCMDLLPNQWGHLQPIGNLGLYPFGIDANWKRIDFEHCTSSWWNCCSRWGKGHCSWRSGGFGWTWYQGFNSPRVFLGDDLDGRVDPCYPVCKSILGHTFRSSSRMIY